MYKRSTVDNKLFNKNRSLKSNSDVCGIINLGNNCYLNSGLQILASCEKLIFYLNRTVNYDYEKNNILNLLKVAFDSLLNKKIYDPEIFMNEFCKLNKEFFNRNQNCSQTFIRTLIKNINECYTVNIFGSSLYKPSDKFKNIEYEKFIKSSKAFPGI